jgi:hypothetical protein
MELKLRTLVTTQTTFLERERRRCCSFISLHPTSHAMTSTHLVLRAVSNLPAQTGAVRLRSDFPSLQFQCIIMFRGTDRHSQLVPTVLVANRMPSVLFFCRAVEVEIQLLDRPLTGLRTKVVEEEATPSLTPTFREGRATSPVSPARFSPQQVRILN